MKRIYRTLIIGAFCAAQFMTAGAQALSDSAKVNIAFRSVEQQSLMGGVSAVDVESLSNKNNTTYSLENMQNYVGGYDGELWNMGEVLVLVDGVPRDATNIMPSEISSITFLKSAQSVVLYGSRAARGAILITTKRGNNEDLQVSVHGNAFLYVPKSYPKYLGSAEYMTLYNEALANDGLDAAFSTEDIYNYSTLSNTYRYPNTNFFSDEYLKKSYMRYDATAEFRGGGKYAKYYANIGLYNTDDLIAFGQGKDNHDTRLHVRGNIDLTLNDWISGWVNTSAAFYDRRRDNSDFWSQSAIMRPTQPGSNPLVPLIPVSMLDPTDEQQQIYKDNTSFLIDGQYLLGGTQIYQTNPFAGMYAGGYNKWTSRNLQFDLGVNINLDQLVKGLSFRTQYAVDYATSYTSSINTSYRVFEATWDQALGKDMITSLQSYGEDKLTNTLALSNSAEKQTMMFSAQFNYDRTFNDVHNLSAILLGHGYQQTISGEYHRVSNVNLGLNVSYNYAQRYYGEFSSAVVHSAKFAPGKRNAFSPTVSLGWRISQEPFMENVGWVNELKLSTGYSVINQDLLVNTYYLYEDAFSVNSSWWGWNEVATALRPTDFLRSGNPDLTFTKRKEFTVSLNTSLFNDHIRLNSNFFRTDITDIPVTAVNFPAHFMTYWPQTDIRPYINYNAQRHTGFDYSLNYLTKAGDFNFNIGFNGMYVKSTNIKVNEVAEYDWLRQEGQSVSAMRGYQCLGYFSSAEEIAQSAVINSNTKPGDLKYKDQNEDGIIDSKDQVVIGKWTAPYVMGINLSASYKGFTLFVGGHGAFGGQGLKNNSYWHVYGDRKYSEVVLGRWTPETADVATYPRLTTQSGDLNFVTSDYWMYNTDAFYLDKVQLTYDFPSSWFAGKFIRGLQIYVNGSSLATISKERKYLEMNVGTSPQTRAYNLGVKVDF